MLLLLLLPFESLTAQRMGHRASRGGGRSMSARPSPQRTAPSRQPSSYNAPSRSINGGHTRSNDRSHHKTPSTPQRENRKSADRSSKNQDRRPTASNERQRTSEIKNRSGNRDINKNTRDININNNRNININNTRVVRSTRVYVRPPIRYGGMAFYAHRAFYWHPYRPFYWGPVWHPWGFFVATMATTAVIISVQNQQYHCDHGVYYVEDGDGYTVVQAPIGATVESLPEETEIVQVNETTNNYYYGGAFYEKSDLGYTVVPATAGTIVPHLPEGGEEVKIGDQTFVQFGDTYYMPIQLDGVNMYEIVDVREDEGA